MTTDLNDEDRTLWLDAAMAELDRREQPVRVAAIAANVAAMDDATLNATIAKLSQERRQREHGDQQALRQIVRPPEN